MQRKNPDGGRPVADDLGTCVGRFLELREQPRTTGRDIAKELFRFASFQSLILAAIARGLLGYEYLSLQAEALLGETWEVLLVYFERTKGLSYRHESVAGFRAWIWVITRRVVRRLLRKKAKEKFLRAGQVHDGMAAVPQPESWGELTPVERDLMRDRVMHLIARHVSGKRRRAVMLVQMLTWDVRVTADVCGIKEATVKRYIREELPGIRRRLLADEP